MVCTFEVDDDRPGALDGGCKSVAVLTEDHKALAMRKAEEEEDFK